MAKKKDEINVRSSAAEYLTYVASVGELENSFEMRYEDENIWLTQKMMAILYEMDVRTINEHMQILHELYMGMKSIKFAFLLICRLLVQ